MRIVLSNYFEDIRFAKFDFDALLRNLKERNITYKFNNTLYNVIKERDKNNTNDIYDPFEIFNSERMKNLNIVFRFLIRPSYQNLVIIIKDYIYSTKNFFMISIIILFSFYLGIITFIYFVIWKQFENNLNSKVLLNFYFYLYDIILLISLIYFNFILILYKIFKNKNMLTIIPKETLATLSNIHRLIGIQQKVTKKINTNSLSII